MRDERAARWAPRLASFDYAVQVKAGLRDAAGKPTDQRRIRIVDRPYDLSAREAIARVGLADLVLGPPADAARVAKTRKLPSSLGECLMTTPSAKWRWHLQESVTRDAERRPTYGGCLLSLDAVVAAEKARAKHGAHGTHPLWRESYGLACVPNGDLLAVAREDESIWYLDHEAGGAQAYRLAADVFAWMESWSRIACAGPESWVLDRFRDGSGGPIDPDGPNARSLREWLGVADEAERSPYSPDATLTAGRWVQHARFGAGFVTSSSDGVAEVVFGDGSTCKLVHGRG